MGQGHGRHPAGAHRIAFTARTEGRSELTTDELTTDEMTTDELTTINRLYTEALARARLDNPVTDTSVLPKLDMSAG